MSQSAIRTECCTAVAYQDALDKGWYCTTCDAPIDPKTGRQLTERERDPAYGLGDPIPRAGRPD